MRVLGFDPGAAHTGWVLIEVSGRDERWIDGGAVAQIWTVMPKGAHLRDADIWAVESVAAVAPRDGFGPRMAKYLIDAAKVCGEILAEARVYGRPVVEVTAATWRKAIVGSGRATDAQVAQALALRFGGSMPRSNAHARDAAGCALYAARHAELATRLAAGAGR